ncbi:MAG: protein translocase subunit SecD [bacterium]|nr:protein translocase subunit SecD [bacterium]
MQKRRFSVWLIFILTLFSLVVVLPEQYYGLSGINIAFGKVRIQKDFRTSLGLDLAGGSHLVFEAKLEEIDQADKERALEAARNIIERRVNYFGISEAQVQTSKSGESSRIIVELPGVEDVGNAVDLIGKTAQLKFRESPEGTPSAEELAENQSPEALMFGPFTIDSGITGRNLKRAVVQFDQQSGEPVVGLTFDDEGAKLFAEATKRNINRQLAIFLDDQIVSAPRVNETITEGQAQISGGFTVDAAKQLTTQLNAGALPVSIELISQRNIGPTLGQLAIDKSMLAGSVGLLMVAFFMIGFYGQMGVIAVVALIIYGLISFAVFKAIPVTLTLSGIAGFMLSIGMAVDANILIFERVREEIRDGLPWQQAMEIAFGRAWDSIRDANVATLLTTFILFNPLDWQFLPRFGLIRGFALTLAIGVIIGLFTGVFVTRTLMRMFYRSKK